MDAAIELQEAGSFASAAAKVRTAWMLVASLPDSELRDERLRWKPDSIGLILKDLETRAAAVGGEHDHGAIIRPTHVEYQRG
jgi:hypothetical protein